MGLSLLVFGVRQSGTWGFVKAKPGQPQLLGTSPVVWLVIGGLLVIYGFFLWEGHLAHLGGEPLTIRPAMLRNSQLAGGLSMFFFQFFIQAGAFFTIAVLVGGTGVVPRCRPACACCRCRSPCWPRR